MASPATTPQTSFSGSASAWVISASRSSLEIFMLGGQPYGGWPAGLPPDGRVEILDLVDRQRVDAARQVLPAVIGDEEHDVALVQLARDPHGDARDRATGDAREDALLVEQPAGPDDRVAVGDEDLAVEQRDVDDRRDEAVFERAQALHGLA